MPHKFKQAICNEVYEKRPLHEVCKSIRRIGYDGIEIAPFTLAETPADVSAARRREYRATIQDAGLGFVGLHWLMVSPKGLHVTTPDRELRARSWRHIDDLIDLCADLGDSGVMVFGSPAQRGTTGGTGREEAMKNYTEGLSGVAPHAASRGVTILVEALPKNQCDVINSLDEAAGIVRTIGSPAVRTMFDIHNAVDETEPHAALLDRYFDLIRHVHINEMDGRHPGTGDYDFKPGADKIAADSLRFVEAEI